MPLVRHVLSATVPVVQAGSTPHGFAIAPFDGILDSECLTSLVTYPHADDRAAAARPTAAGLGRELLGRPDRRVHTWLARVAEPHANGGSCLGLIALVDVGQGRTRRFSISWLLVSPLARRRGIGTALVDRAVRMAATLGATHVFVETRADWPAARAFWDAMASR